MIDRAQPAFARRIRLSTGAIIVALVLTCIALLAIAATVRPASEGHAAVTIEGPISSFSPSVPFAAGAVAKAKSIVIPVSATAPVGAVETAQ